MDSKNLPENQDNKFLIDWLSFTSPDHSIFSILDFLGLSELRFETTYGFQGYRQRMYFDGISIHYDHPRNEGVWVEMSGQGCRNFESFSTVGFDKLIFALCDAPAGEFHITRLDVAFDDFKKIIPLDKLVSQILYNQFVTKFEGHRFKVCLHPGFVGMSCELGTCKSDVFMRIYDKAYERGFYDEIKEGFSWTRWEIQMRNDRALNFLRAVYNGLPVGEVFIGVLKNYFRVVDPDKNDSNKWRWKTSKWFRKFTGNVEKLSIFTPCKIDYNLYKCETFVYKMAGNAVATLIKIKGVEKFLDELMENKPEGKLKYKDLLNQYQAEKGRMERIKKDDDFE